MGLWQAVKFVQLLLYRKSAEDIARKVRSQQVLTKLRKSKVRQPLQVFQVKIWRKYTTDVGPRGGLRKTGRSHWLGPVP